METTGALQAAQPFQSSRTLNGRPASNLGND